MLIIEISSEEYYNETTCEFVKTVGGTLKLEHSLVSLTKWEEKYKKPFLMSKPNEERTTEEMIYYIRCMTLNEVDSSIYNGLTNDHINRILRYIEDPMTATTIRHDGPKKSGGVVTAEIIYYWMVALQIPFECQYWHLNKLLTLVEVCNIKQQPPKKMGRKQTAAHNRSLNQQRRRRTGSKG